MDRLGQMYGLRKPALTDDDLGIRRSLRFLWDSFVHHATHTVSLFSEGFFRHLPESKISFALWSSVVRG